MLICGAFPAFLELHATGFVGLPAVALHHKRCSLFIGLMTRNYQPMRCGLFLSLSIIYCERLNCEASMPRSSERQSKKDKNENGII
jgi:hypothetical protein